MADGGLGEIGDIVQRIRELAVAAANGTLATSDQHAISEELKQLHSEIDATSERTRFNGISLLGSGSQTMNLQVGPNSGDTLEVSLEDFTTGGALASFGSQLESFHGLAMSASTGSFFAAASQLIDGADAALGLVNRQRATLGATQNRLEHNVAAQQIATDNMAAAHSRIRDVDVAAESARMIRAQIRMQAAVAVMAQINQQRQLVLKLLEF